MKSAPSPDKCRSLSPKKPLSSCYSERHHSKLHGFPKSSPITMNIRVHTVPNSSRQGITPSESSILQGQLNVIYLGVKYNEGCILVVEKGHC